MGMAELGVKLQIDTEKFKAACENMSEICIGLSLDLKNTKAMLEFKKLLQTSDYLRIKEQYEPKTFYKYPSNGLSAEMMIIDELHNHK